MLGLIGTASVWSRGLPWIAMSGSVSAACAVLRSFLVTTSSHVALDQRLDDADQLDDVGDGAHHVQHGEQLRERLRDELDSLLFHRPGDFSCELDRKSTRLNSSHIPLSR